MHSHRIRHIALAVLASALLVLGGCNIIGDAITGSGVVVEQEYDFTDFNEVHLSHAFTGNITQGTPYRVVVRVDDNLVDNLLVTQDGNRVAIGLEQGALITRATMEVDITMPDLAALNVSGASQAQLNGFATSGNFTGVASGASRIHGDITTGDADLEASGASSISLAGAGDNVRAVASGASTIDLEEFTVTDAQVEASGASNVTVNIDGVLDADASGGSNIFYLGEPEMGDIQTSGASNVGPR